MSMTMVNGYSCANCADISKAKRGEDPQQSPAEKIQQEAARAAQANALLPDAVAPAADTERVRAPLDFSHMLDKLA
jgi:hypothetical protein